MDIEDKRLQKLIKGYRERDIIQQIAIDLLYRVGRLSGTEIGEIIGVDYSTVSVERKRLREKMKDYKHLSQIIKSVETDLSTIKIWPLILSLRYAAKKSYNYIERLK